MGMDRFLEVLSHLKVILRKRRGSFFEVVVPVGPSVVVLFVATVIHQTIGWIVNYRTGERREWWEASYSEIGRVAGIKSRASVAKAIRLSRGMGYVIRREGPSHFLYRLREVGEAVDVPEKKKGSSKIELVY